MQMEGFLVYSERCMTCWNQKLDVKRQFLSITYRRMNKINKNSTHDKEEKVKERNPSTYRCNVCDN